MHIIVHKEMDKYNDYNENYYLCENQVCGRIGAYRDDNFVCCLCRKLYCDQCRYFGSEYPIKCEKQCKDEDLSDEDSSDEEYVCKCKNINKIMYSRPECCNWTKGNMHWICQICVDDSEKEEYELVTDEELIDFLLSKLPDYKSKEEAQRALIEFRKN